MPASTPAARPGPAEMPATRRSGARGVLFCAIAAAPLLVLGGTTVMPGGLTGEAKAVALPLGGIAAQQRAVAALTEGAKSEIIAEGESAKMRNGEIRFSNLPLEHVSAFRAQAVPANAQRCLAQAIYYEAGYEPEQGKRGVAQVVLNRVRHPAYPDSVCGVVYQGVNQPVCQFSFTCDGSLNHRPAPAAWADAERVAREALAGRVEESVGTATHYHADYVVPRWAYALGKVRQLGSHIFYRFNGALGRASAFNARYSGAESIPDIRMADLGGPDPITGLYANGLTVAPDVKDRHAENDIGGRLDTTKGWKLELPRAGRYRQLVARYDTHKAAEPVDAAPAGLAAPAPEAKPGFALDPNTESADPDA